MRDQRDPQLLGEELLARGVHWRKADIARPHDHDPYPGLARTYDVYKHKMDVEDYDHGESTVQQTVAQYRRELQQQAALGDAAAARVLSQIDGSDVDIPTTQDVPAAPETLAHTNGHEEQLCLADEIILRTDNT